MNTVKRVAAINDLSGFGRCSLTVAIPIISAFGFQVCPFPTAVLSTHTGFNGFTFWDFTDNMSSYAQHWKELNLKFDCIYSGFLGSKDQIDIVKKIFDDFGDNALKIVDPVMGDNGMVYSTYTDEMCQKMKELLASADIITPNLTEAAILLGENYPKNGLSELEVQKWLDRLLQLGPSKVVITGIVRDNKIVNTGKCADNGEAFMHSFEYIKSSFSGTGDIFASCLTGGMLQGKSFNDAVYFAAKFVYECVKYSKDCGTPQSDGVLFEPLLKNL